MLFASIWDSFLAHASVSERVGGRVWFISAKWTIPEFHEIFTGIDLDLIIYVRYCRSCDNAKMLNIFFKVLEIIQRLLMHKYQLFWGHLIYLNRHTLHKANSYNKILVPLQIIKKSRIINLIARLVCIVNFKKNMVWDTCFAEYWYYFEIITKLIMINSSSWSQSGAWFSKKSAEYKRFFHFQLILTDLD